MAETPAGGGGRVHVAPLGVAFDVRPGETVMAAAQRAGFYWPTTCQGEARCATCFMHILAGAAACSRMGRAEATALTKQRGRRALEQPVRLACQTFVTGDLRVRKIGLRPA